MISFPSRLGATALVLTAGLVPVANAQTQQTAAEQTVHTDAQARHLAPHDTFYTLGYDSVRTDKGVEGFPPGTEVHLVSVNREAHTLTVSDGHANVELPPEGLTNDIDVAAMVKAKDDASQAQIAAYQQAQAKAFQEYEKAAADYTNKDLEKKQQEAKQEEQRTEERDSAAQNAQPVSSSYSNGYYNEGGYGYGSPYGYFTNLVPTNVSGGGKGSVPSSQVTAQKSGARAGGATTGAAASGGGGGKKQ